MRESGTGAFLKKEKDPVCCRRGRGKRPRQPGVHESPGLSDHHVVARSSLLESDCRLGELLCHG
jgi:hypothetical protein